MVFTWSWSQSAVAVCPLKKSLVIVYFYNSAPSAPASQSQSRQRELAQEMIPDELAVFQGAADLININLTSNGIAPLTIEDSSVPGTESQGAISLLGFDVAHQSDEHPFVAGPVRPSGRLTAVAWIRNGNQALWAARNFKRPTNLPIFLVDSAWLDYANGPAPLGGLTYNISGTIFIAVSYTHLTLPTNREV